MKKKNKTTMITEVHRNGIQKGCPSCLLFEWKLGETVEQVEDGVRSEGEDLESSLPKNKKRIVLLGVDFTTQQGCKLLTRWKLYILERKWKLSQ